MRCDPGDPVLAAKRRGQRESPPVSAQLEERCQNTGVLAATLYVTFNRTGTICWLGIALIVIVAGAVLARLLTWSRRPPS